MIEATEGLASSGRMEVKEAIGSGWEVDAAEVEEEAAAENAEVRCGRECEMAAGDVEEDIEAVTCDAEKDVKAVAYATTSDSTAEPQVWEGSTFIASTNSVGVVEPGCERSRSIGASLECRVDRKGPSSVDGVRAFETT